MKSRLLQRKIMNIITNPFEILHNNKWQEYCKEIVLDSPCKIHTIFGGLHIGGESRHSQHKYAWEAWEVPFTNIHNLAQCSVKSFKHENKDITFFESNVSWVHHPHNDTILITVKFGNNNVHCILVDNGSIVDILYHNTFIKIDFKDSYLKLVITLLYKFTRDFIMP